MIRSLKLVLLDMDGTIYEGTRLFEDTHAFLADLRARELPYVFLTNNCSKDRSRYVHSLAEMGIEVDEDLVHTSAQATIDGLHADFKGISRLFVLGTEALEKTLRDSGFTPVTLDEEPELVVTAFDTQLTFERLCRAAYWIDRGKPWVATHPDATCPTDLETVLVDCGSITAALTHATGRTPALVAGKPNARMVTGLLETWNARPEETLMVGDRMLTDMGLAFEAGLRSALVLTGATKLSDLDSWQRRPEIVARDLAHLREQLETPRP